METKIIPGCSSFNETYWKGIFYPEDLPRSKYFEFYCRHFNTYEMNGTFYKFPTAKGLTGWYNKAPAGFEFAVKMYKGVTHYKRFDDCERLISEFYEVCRENLKEKLAVVLYQLPASFRYSQENLEKIVNAFNLDFKNAIEFRHESWWRPEVFAALTQKGIAFCNVSYPNLPEDFVATTKTGYIRLHGVPKLFYSGYGQAALGNLKVEIERQHWEKAYVYFNNTASQEGIIDAMAFRKLLVHNR